MRARAMIISFNFASKETIPTETSTVQNTRRDNSEHSPLEEPFLANVRTDHLLASEVLSPPPTLILPDRPTGQDVESREIDRPINLSTQTVGDSIPRVVLPDNIDKRSKKKRSKAKPRDEIDEIFDF